MSAKREASLGLIHNIVPIGALRRAIESMSEELLVLSETTLKRRVQPTQVDWCLRLALWNEIRFAECSGTTIDQQRIYQGICSYQHWVQNVIKSPEKLAWLLCPVVEYQKQIQALLGLAASKYFEVLNSNMTTEDGRLNLPVARLVMDTAKHLESRVYGEPVQATLNQTVNEITDNRRNLKTLSIEEIDEKIKQIVEKSK